MSLKEESTNNIIDSSKATLSFPILRRGIWARKTKNNPMRREKSTQCGIVKFFSVVTLNALYRKMKLIQDISIEITNDVWHLRSSPYRESPCIMCIVIKKHKVIFEPSKTFNRRCPQVTMHYLKGEKCLGNRTRESSLTCLPFWHATQIDEAVPLCVHGIAKFESNCDRDW